MPTTETQQLLLAAAAASEDKKAEDIRILALDPAESGITDYFIIHIFSAEKRAFYGLERLRKSATSLSIADLNAEIKSAIAATRAKAPKKTAAKKPAKKAAVTKPSAKSVNKSAKKAATKTIRSSRAKKSPAAKTRSK